MKSYQYLDEAQGIQGPFNGAELLAKGITPETYVFTEGFATWTKAGEVEELKALFDEAAAINAQISAAAAAETPEQRAVNTYSTKPSAQGTGAPQPSQIPYGPVNGAPSYMGEAKPYLVWSILSTICCCLPLGIVAIVYSVKTDSYNTTMNYEKAWQASSRAKMWSILSAVLGFGMSIFIIIMNAIVGNL